MFCASFLNYEPFQTLADHEAQLSPVWGAAVANGLEVSFLSQVSNGLILTFRS